MHNTPARESADEKSQVIEAWDLTKPTAGRGQGRSARGRELECGLWRMGLGGGALRLGQEHADEPARPPRSADLRLLRPGRTSRVEAQRWRTGPRKEGARGVRVPELQSAAPPERPGEHRASDDLRGRAAGKRKKRSMEVLERVRLTNRARHKPSELSGAKRSASRSRGRWRIIPPCSSPTSPLATSTLSRAKTSWASLRS